jgi:tetratricopeptide (TPR) repeat protein
MGFAALMRHADKAWGTGAIEEARDWYERAHASALLRGAAGDQARTLVWLCNVERRLGRLDLAFAYGDLAMAMLDSRVGGSPAEIRSNALLALGNCHRESARQAFAAGGSAEGMTHLDQAMDLLRRSAELAPSDEVRFWPTISTAVCLEMRGDLDAGLEVALRARAMCDRLPVGIEAARAEAEMATILRDMGRREEALNHYREWYRIVTEGWAPDASPIDVAGHYSLHAWACYQAMQVCLSLGPEHIAEALTWADRGHARTLLAGPGEDAGILDPTEIDKTLTRDFGRDWALLLFACSRDRAWLWVLRSGQAAIVRPLVVEGEALERFVAEMGLPPHEAEGPGRIDLRPLSEIIPQDVLGLLDGLHTWIVIPDGPLVDVPFDALPLDASPGPPRIVVRHVVSYAPSVSWLLGAVQRRQNVAAGAALLVGCRGSGDEHREELPFAEEEAAAVQEMLDGRGRTLTGPRATRSAVLSELFQPHSVIHFATHGTTNTDSARSAGLHLAGGDVLSVDDILSCPRLDAALVTLSACESARGEFVRGEGVIGLPWAFLHRGARSVLATQWTVYDERCCRLMESFYARWKGGESKAEALREAKLELMSAPDSADPYYWAPYMLVGDWR